MEITSLQPGMKSAEVPMERLAGNQKLTEQEKVAEASRQFEAILVRQILQDAQKPLIRSTLVQSTATSEIYRDMVTSHMADGIAKSGMIGLAKTFEKQLSHPAGKGLTVADQSKFSTIKTKGLL